MVDYHGTCLCGGDLHCILILVFIKIKDFIRAFGCPGSKKSGRSCDGTTSNLRVRDGDTGYRYDCTLYRPYGSVATTASVDARAAMMRTNASKQLSSAGLYTILTLTVARHTTWQLTLTLTRHHQITTTCASDPQHMKRESHSSREAHGAVAPTACDQRGIGRAPRFAAP